MAAGFGHNDADGKVYCHLCDWEKDCGPNMERIEHELRKHLRDSHAVPCLYRIDSDNGKRTDIPVFDGDLR